MKCNLLQARALRVQDPGCCEAAYSWLRLVAFLQESAGAELVCQCVAGCPAQPCLHCNYAQLCLLATGCRCTWGAKRDRPCAIVGVQALASPGTWQR